MNAPLPPTPSPPAAHETIEQLQQHIRLLSVFHYIVAGLAALFALLPLIHLAVGIGLVSGRLGEAEPDATLVGWAFVAVSAVFIVSGLVLAGFIAYAGRCLQRRRRHTLCLAVAGLECMLMPFGTVLGVFTLIVLMKPQVKPLFAPS